MDAVVRELVAMIVLGAVALGCVLSVLALLVIRGRFGTPRRRAALDLTELAATPGIKRTTTMRRSAVCNGHSARSVSLLGTGILWLSDDQVGFDLRRPRRRFTIDLAKVVSVSAEHSVERPGTPELVSPEPLLVVRWHSETGESMISWSFDDIVDGGDVAEWVDALERGRVANSTDILTPR